MSHKFDRDHFCSGMLNFVQNNLPSKYELVSIWAFLLIYKFYWLLIGDFNSKCTKLCLFEFLTICDSMNLIKERTCYTVLRIVHVQVSLSQYLSNFHEWMSAVSKTFFQKLSPNEAVYRNYKKPEGHFFRCGLKDKSQCIKECAAFENIFLSVLN